MNLARLRSMYRFNTWANENLRQGIEGADEALVQRPLDMWFGSAFNVLAHLCAGEAIWLARLRDGETPARLLTAADFPGLQAMLQAWRRLDSEWEDYVKTLTNDILDSTVSWRRQEGETFTNQLWQPVLHVAFHGTEHRGHASVALTALGIEHGPQDFLYQFLPPPSATRPMD
ncbi:MAG TPA: DinB family protein [Dehalococcoidia bacterium]|nr:DinB family protein [Dehalococcoidia bacterium]